MSELAPLTGLMPAAASPRSQAAQFPAVIDPTLLDALLSLPMIRARAAPTGTLQGGLLLMTTKGSLVLPTGPDLPAGADVEVRLVGRTPPVVSMRLVEPPPPVRGPAAEIVKTGPLPAVLLAAPSEDPRAAGAPLLARILSVTPPATGIPTSASRAQSGLEASQAPARAPAPQSRALGEIAASAEGRRGAGTPPPTAPGAAPGGMPGTIPFPSARPATPASLPPRAADAPQLGPQGPTTSAGDPVPDARPQFAPGARAEKVQVQWPAALPEGELVGPVVRQTPAGSVIATPHYTIAVEGLDAPEGALVRFILVDPPAPAATRTPRRGPWSALSLALHALQANAPEDAERLAADLNPREPARLAAALRLIAAALRNGTTPYPGEALERALVEAGRTDLVPALRDETRSLARSVTESTGRWDVVPLPLHDGTQLTEAFLYVEREAARETQTGEEEARRFMIEVQTRLLGRLRLDGLLRPRRFDLLLRSRVQLDPVMRAEIESIFRATLDSAGWAGDVAFTATPTGSMPLPGERIVESV